MKKEIRIIFLAFSILLISFLVFNSGILDFIGKPSINSKAASGALSVSITIKVFEAFPSADSNGVTESQDKTLEKHIHKVIGLNQGDLINGTFFGSSYPVSEWTQTAPSTSEVKSSIKYLEINFSNSSGVHTGTFSIYFNVTQAELGSISASNVRLFVFENSWTELTTTVVDSLSDPLQFYATTSHFSRFIIGEAPPSGGSGGISEVTGSSGGGGDEITTEIIKEIEKKPEPIKIIGDLFDVSLIIPEKYSELFAGEELVAELSIINIKKSGIVTLNLEYFIEDKNKNVLFREFESKVSENNINFIKTVTLPLNINPGYYLFTVKLKNGEDEAIAGYPFKIIVKKEERQVIFPYKELIYLLILVFIIIFLIVILKLRKLKKKIETNIRKQSLIK